MRTSIRHLSAGLLAFALALSTAVADVSLMAPAPAPTTAADIMPGIAPAADITPDMNCEELIFTLFEHCTSDFGVPVSDAKNNECCQLSRKANMGGCYCDSDLVEASKDMGVPATSIEATLLYCGVAETEISIAGIAGCDLPVAATPVATPVSSPESPAPAPLPSIPAVKAPLPSVVVPESPAPAPLPSTPTVEAPPLASVFVPEKAMPPMPTEEAAPAPEYEDVVSAQPPASPIPCKSYKIRGVRH